MRKTRLSDKIGKDYIQKLLTIKGDWFSQEEYQEARIQVAKRLESSQIRQKQTPRKLN